MSLTRMHVHLVFSTKGRRAFLQSESLREELYAYLGGACRDLKCPPVRVGGHVDHVHLLFHLAPTLALSDLVRDLKRESSKWIKRDHRGLDLFRWQREYGAFSVSPGHLDAVIEYIDGQGEHHRGVTFQDEFRRLCAKYGVEIDERYAWN